MYRSTDSSLTYSLVVALVSVVVVCVIVFAVSWERGRQAARTAACVGKLTYIGLLVRNYSAIHGTYPPSSGDPTTDGVPISWRVLVTRAHMDGYDASEAWNSLHNERFIRALPGTFFACPGDQDGASAGRTSYLAVVGDGTVWSEVRLGHIHRPEEEVPDKIVVVEIPDSDVSWTEPRDISPDEVMALFRRRQAFRHGRHGKNLNYLTASGRVYSFCGIASADELAARLFVHSDSPESHDLGEIRGQTGIRD